METCIITAVVLGLVEGLTEFIPISSTAHLILVGKLMHFEGARAATFEIFIQLGAILAVVVVYWRRFLESSEFSPDQRICRPARLGIPVSHDPAGAGSRGGLPQRHQDAPLQPVQRGDRHGGGRRVDFAGGTVFHRRSQKQSGRPDRGKTRCGSAVSSAWPCGPVCPGPPPRYSAE